MLVKTCIGESDASGIGLFAGEAILEGTRMWVFDGRVDKFYSKYDLSGMPCAALAMLTHYGQFTDTGDLLLCGDDARFANHSETPSMLNMETFAIAARDLAQGDEITEDYRTFAPGACASFLKASP